MESLLNNRLTPITDAFGFLQCDLQKAVDAYSAWQTPIQAARFVRLEQSVLKGSLEEDLLGLLPLTSVERRRFLFIPTASSWTAFFDNGHQSTDAFSPLSYLARTIGCQALRVFYIPDGTFVSKHPARLFELYGPDKTDWLNVIRSVGAISDKRWVFHATGAVQSFEQTDRYALKTVKDRFTPEMLDQYLRALGIRAFQEDFYLSTQAILLSKQGPVAPNLREFGL
ncbi:MAG: hypothetical protein ACRYFU_24680 [Janthinobacterium lividum]